MSAKQPIAISHWYYWRYGWAQMSCETYEGINHNVEIARMLGDRHYIEWLDTNHGDGRDD